MSQIYHDAPKRNSGDLRETALEHVYGDDYLTFTTSEQKWINRIRKLKDEHPSEVNIRYENADGSICGRLPSSWMKLSPPRVCNLTDERRSELAERMRKARKQ